MSIGWEAEVAGVVGGAARLPQAADTIPPQMATRIRSCMESVRAGWWWVIGAVWAICPGTPASAQSFASVDDAVRAGISRRVFPGAAVIIGRHDSTLYARGYGHLTWNASAPAPNADSTIWDLASLTKVLGPASVAARFVDRGLLELDAPVARWIECFRGGEHSRITVRMLLDHTSGLMAYRRVGESGDGVRGALRDICSERLQSMPGTEVRYSDLNAIVLGALLQQVGGAPLDDLVQREVAEPLGLASLRFGAPDSTRRRAAPTSRSAGLIVRGAVNDWNAARLQGVAGHAGLFATAADVARFARVWLREGTIDSVRWISAETARRFLTITAVTDGRRLGWDVVTAPEKPSDDPSAFGSLASSATYGHLGWTGTMLWVDPARDLFVVFLTNRAYEPRGRRSLERMREVRTAVSDAVIQAAGPRCVAEAFTPC